ncbi:MAG: alpha-ketoglutarate-dependent dioxygenase AlkB [Gemmataceae bacterium]|nr:alpha-ketoglutarate-dependent dioxygenase AlkB [Gemmataceae bacterium]
MFALDERFEAHDLGDGLRFFSGILPGEYVWDEASFDRAWALHPVDRPSILMHGRPVIIPRWQQAYGADYYFSGQTSNALPVPEMLAPLLEWTRSAIHPDLNGLLLNWYDGPGHYIGEHHDEDKDLVAGTPIVTISFGETRTFRLSRGKGPDRVVRDFTAESGSVFVLPQDTNAVWKHAVPKSTRYTGRRVSVTIRAFTTGADGPRRVNRGPTQARPPGAV